MEHEFIGDSVIDDIFEENKLSQPDFDYYQSDSYEVPQSPLSALPELPASLISECHRCENLEIELNKYIEKLNQSEARVNLLEKQNQNFFFYNLVEKVVAEVYDGAIPYWQLFLNVISHVTDIKNKKVVETVKTTLDCYLHNPYNGYYVFKNIVFPSEVEKNEDLQDEVERKEESIVADDLCIGDAVYFPISYDVNVKMLNEFRKFYSRSNLPWHIVQKKAMKSVIMYNKIKLPTGKKPTIYDMRNAVCNKKGVLAVTPDISKLFGLSDLDMFCYNIRVKDY